MRRPTLLAGQLVTLLAVCMGGSGCLPCHWCPHGCPLVLPRPLPPEVVRGSLADVILAQPAPAVPATFRSIRTDSFPYHALSPLDCQCEAVAHAPLADALDRERQRICERGGKRKTEAKREMQQAILYYLALEIRNDASGIALAWYYRIAGGEAATDLTVAGINEVNKAMVEVEEMRGKGLRVPVEVEKIRRQSLGLQEQLTQARLDVEQYNERLHQLLDHGCNPAWYIWPEPLPAGGSVPIPDVDTAVSVGLAERPYLKLIRYLLTHLDEDTLPSAHDSLGKLFARSEPTDCKLVNELLQIFFPHAMKRATLESIHNGLCELLRRQEAHVASSIRRAIYQMRGHNEKTLLAQMQVQRWDVELLKMREKVAHGMLSSLELVDPTVDRLKTQGDVCKEWLIVLGALAKLQQAQGLLVKECLCPGSTMPLSVPADGAALAPAPEAEAAPHPTQLPEEKGPVLPRAG